MKHDLRILLSLSVLAPLAACSALPSSDNGTYRDASARSSGEYRQVQQDGELSPMEAHRLAKAQVDPKHVNKKNAYVKTAQQVQEAQNRRERVVAMERDLGVVKNDFKGLKDSVQNSRIASAIVTPGVKPQIPSNIAPASGNAGAAVKAIRTGEYPDKTRLVLDLDAPAEFQYDVDNTQNLLLLRVSAAHWATVQEKIFSGSKALKAYAAKSSGDGGVLVALKLKAPSKVLQASKLGKNAAGDYRIYLDVAPL